MHTQRLVVSAATNGLMICFVESHLLNIKPRVELWTAQVLCVPYFSTEEVAVCECENFTTGQLKIPLTNMIKWLLLLPVKQTKYLCDWLNESFCMTIY